MASKPKIALSLATAMLMTIHSKTAALLHCLPRHGEALFANRMTIFPEPLLHLDEDSLIEVLRDGSGYRFSRRGPDSKFSVVRVAERSELMAKITDHVIARVIAGEKAAAQAIDFGTVAPPVSSVMNLLPSAIPRRS